MSRYLWIDQICINQTDIDEKIQQIGIMGEIYVKAESTIVWLGEGDATSDLAMQLFPIFVKVVQFEEERRVEPSTATADFSDWSRGLGVHICNLFTKAWFGRVWTLQEVALSSKAEVWCGSYSFPFNLIETFERGCNNDQSGNWSAALEAIGWRSRKVDAEMPDRSMIAHTYTVASLKSGGMSSTRVLESLRSLDCTEHQDRVYSVLRFLDEGLVSEVLRTEERNPEGLYRVVAMKMLEDGDLDLLGAAGRSQHRATYRGESLDRDTSRPYLTLPSWVPDWTFTSRRTPYWVLNRDHLLKRGTQLFSTGGPPSNPDYLIQFTSNPNSIRLPVIPIGTISQYTPPFRRPNLPSSDSLDDATASITYMTSAITHYANYVNLATDLAVTNCTQRYSTPALATSACHSTLTANLTSPIKRTSQTGTLIPATPQEIHDQFTTFNTQVHISSEQSWAFSRLATMATTPLTPAEILRIQNLTVAANSATTQSNTNRQLITAITEICSGRCFAVTEDGRMAMVPDVARVGDLIGLVVGACTPVVVRRVPGDCFEVVGEGFVDGVMHGEGLEGGWEGLVEWLDVV